MGNLFSTCEKLNIWYLKTIFWRIKDGTQLTLNLSSDVADDSRDEVNFSHKLLLTDLQVSRLRKAFANHLPGNIKLIQFWGLLSSLLPIPVWLMSMPVKSVNSLMTPALE